MIVPGFPQNNDFRVVVIPPMGYAYTSFIDGGIDDMQGIVGGLVECLHTGIGVPEASGRAIDFWCNEEFTYAEDMVFNRVLVYRNGHMQPIYGQMLACAAFTRSGESAGLTRAEALSILGAENLKEPQLLRPVAGGAMVSVVSDGAGEAFTNMLKELSIEAKEANQLPLEGAGIDALVPAPIVGKPEDIVVGKWRVHLVYPGEQLADGSHVYERETSDVSGMGLPIVEFYDLSQEASAWPGGQYVSSYYMSTLMNLDGKIPGCAIGEGLESGSGLDLFASVKGWTVEGGEYQVVRHFISQAHVACMMAGRAAAPKRPQDIASAATAIAEGCKLERGASGMQVERGRR